MKEKRRKFGAHALTSLVPEITLPQVLSDIVYSGVSMDSRSIQPGDVFIALNGAKINGEQFISSAVNAGAVCVLVNSSPSRNAGIVTYEKNIPIISVHDLSRRVSHLAGVCYGDPSNQFPVVGVTGTNGKSTCVSLVAQLHDLLGGKAATIGTLGVDSPLGYTDLGMTTPDAVTCQRVLHELHLEKINLVAMEVSSHGLDQNRVAAIHFDTAIFTNLSHDHLDYHGNLEAYRKAKQKLFEMSGLQNAIINLDDPSAGHMVDVAKANARVVTYSLLHFVADVYASDVSYTSRGCEFYLTTPWGQAWVSSPLLGEFNVYNLLAAISVFGARGVEFEKLIGLVPQLESVPGRMQPVTVKGDITCIVDYAHTPDALAQAIAAVRVHTEGELWVVFGCGGERDTSKRPSMAKIAEHYADYVVVTSDNPRTESPEKIIAEICGGFTQCDFHSIRDRREAIYFATQSAQPGDVILLAGKGHETYQLIGEEKKPFDDVLICRQAMQERMSVGSYQ